MLTDGVGLTDLLVGAVTVDPARRDREVALAAAAARVREGDVVAWDRVDDPGLRRRVGYLVEVSQRARGQLPDEAAALAAVRDGLPPGPMRPFWPGERPLPPGADPVAERWGFSRGVDLLRLQAAMAGRVELLPDGAR